MGLKSYAIEFKFDTTAYFSIFRMKDDQLSLLNIQRKIVSF